MQQSSTKDLLWKKILKILSLLLLVRVGLYIPVPGIDLNIFNQGQVSNPMFGFAKTLVGNSFLGVGSLGILPYINASIIIQLLIPIFPNLEKLQKEEGEIGRQQINKYTRYLTFVWALVLSTAVSIFLVKPITFDWSFTQGIEVVLSLTVGSILSMWFAELITEEGLGNGSSMIIFINIVGGIPANFQSILEILNKDSFWNDVLKSLEGGLIYLFIVLIIILFQDSYKKVNIVSAKQLNMEGGVTDQSQNLLKLKNSFIPLKLNQGGIMPLVFSSTVAVFFVYPIQILFSSQLSNIGSNLAGIFIPFYSFTINLFLVVFFSCFYVSVSLKPKDMAENLGKMAYNIPGVKQGAETTKYLEKVTAKLAFISGLFLAFLAFFPLLIGNLFQFNVFKNLTSLLILISVITDTTSQIRGYLIATRYDDYKKI